jgi:hypothetical protein
LKISQSISRPDPENPIEPVPMPPSGNEMFRDLSPRYVNAASPASSLAADRAAAPGASSIADPSVVGTGKHARHAGPRMSATRE